MFGSVVAFPKDHLVLAVLAVLPALSHLEARLIQVPQVILAAQDHLANPVALLCPVGLEGRLHP